MHLGLGLCFQALDGKISDKDVYRLELGLAARTDVGGDLGVSYEPELQYAAAD
jgi:hypothetical protein